MINQRPPVTLSYPPPPRKRYIISNINIVENFLPPFLKGCQRMWEFVEIVRGCQKFSEVVRGGLRLSEIVVGFWRLSEVVRDFRGNQRL